MNNEKKRSFSHIATLVRKYRKSHPKKIGQEELARQLGLKNGQFISNVERGKCSIPLKSLRNLVEVLNIPHEELIDAVVKDYRETVYNHMNRD